MNNADQGFNTNRQVQVDLKNATQRECDCGCQFFIQVLTAFTISKLMSPTGSELAVHQPALLCMECKKQLI